MCGSFFDNFPFIHDESILRHIASDMEVVSDEYEAEVLLLLYGEQEVEDVGSCGDVERGGGFICDEEFRFFCKGDGDHDSLALAT